MTTLARAALLALLTPLLVDKLPTGAAQEQPPTPIDITSKRGREILDILATPIETKHFQEAMPLAKFLALLEKQLPDGNKLFLRIDDQAFGKDFARIAATPIRLDPVPRKLSLSTVLRLVLSRSGPDVTYGIWPTYIAITTPGRTVYTATYEIKDLLDRPSRFGSDLVKFGRILFGKGVDLTDVKRTDVLGLLVALILRTDDPDSWNARTPNHGTLQILNGTQLVVRATQARQAAINDFLEAIRRQTDLAVVMRAELYEVDQTFYAKHIGPLLAVPGKAARLLVPVEDGLSHQIEKHKLVLKGEPLKLVEGGQGPLLSLQSGFTYLANLKGYGLSGQRTYKTAVEGVSVFGRVTISPDRRSVRLTLTQNVTQFLGMKQAEDIDFASGKAAAVEAPALKKEVLAATANIEDTSACLMPLAYRSQEAQAKGRIWVLLLRPRIRIEEEERAIRRGEIPLPPGATPPGEPAKGAAVLPAQPPGHPEAATILRATVADVLTNQALAKTRKFYGTAGENRFTLVDGSAVAWPKAFSASVPAHTQVQVTRADQSFATRRLLGISLALFEVRQDQSGIPTARIELAVSTAGGTANGGVLGGCRLSYTVRQQGKRWVAELGEVFDP